MSTDDTQPETPGTSGPSETPGPSDGFDSLLGAAPESAGNSRKALRAQREAAEEAERLESFQRQFQEGDRQERRQALAEFDARPAEKPRRRRRWVPLVVTLTILAALGGGAAAAWFSFQPQIQQFVTMFEPKEFDGTPGPETTITIVDGDTASSLAPKLREAGVIKNADAFYRTALAARPEPVFHAGVYSIPTNITSSAALVALTSSANAVSSKVVIPEGTMLPPALDIIAESTGVARSDLDAASAEILSSGILPAEATTLEGFVFPATYTFDPDTSARAILDRMVARSFEALDAAGVAPDQRWHTVVLAALIQREAGLADDYPKVSRVFLNRLDPALWPSGLLQSDATVAYGTGQFHTVETTPAQRADESNPYNTYAHPGLPSGPISNPGDLAINAALHPADGSWLFFVTWNLDTGETAFSTTMAEHDAAVARWGEWMRENGR